MSAPASGLDLARGGAHDTARLLRRKHGGPSARLSLRLLLKERKKVSRIMDI